MADTFANGDQGSRWSPLPGTRERRDVDTSPPNIRWFIELLNYVLIENYKLRQELSQTRPDDDQLFEVTATAPDPQHDRIHWQETGERRRVATGPHLDRDDAPLWTAAAREDRAAVPRPERGAQVDTSQLVSREEHDRVISQLEALGDELQSLRSEVRSALWRVPAAQQAKRTPQSTAQGPRFEPIQSSRSDLTFEASPHPGMWMKLRHPWFYLPLIWITLLGLLALAVFLLFFS